MIDVDYAYYTGTYSGTLPVDVFNRLKIKVNASFNIYTNNRWGSATADMYSDAILTQMKIGFCEAMDYFASVTDNGTSIPHGVLTHESVGPRSVTYATTGSNQSWSKRLKDIIVGCLNGTKLYCSWC